MRGICAERAHLFLYICIDFYLLDYLEKVQVHISLIITYDKFS